MALSLTAQQQSVIEMFNNGDVYRIPEYQRPYSWEYEQCFQLYNDIREAFEQKRDHFIGNIIIARSNDSNRSFPSVVDGQQRLITLWIILRVLNILEPNMKIIERLLTVESRMGNTHYLKIDSKVLESNDCSELDDIMKGDADFFNKVYESFTDRKGVFKENGTYSRIKKNAIYFYCWFKDFFDRASQEMKYDYINFILDRIVLLPIELNGSTIEEAGDKALVIFETINNRGLDLKNADIFKARLFNKAKTYNEQDIFVKKWIEFNSSCQDLSIDVDEVFRYYSHIIRGKENIISGEKNLKDFFISDPISPLVNLGYNDVLDALKRIISILQFLAGKYTDKSEVSPWIQILSQYSNIYPQYAVVVYLYYNKCETEEEQSRFVRFLKSIIRYCFIYGSTSYVKFEIYKIIANISYGTDISDYSIDNEMSFDNIPMVGRMKKAFALLSFYLRNPEIKLGRIYFEKIAQNTDSKQINSEFSELASIFVSDFYVGKITEKKLLLLKESTIQENYKLIQNKDNEKYIKQREEEIRKSIINFFTNNNERDNTK